MGFKTYKTALVEAEQKILWTMCPKCNEQNPIKVDPKTNKNGYGCGNCKKSYTGAYYAKGRLYAANGKLRESDEINEAKVHKVSKKAFKASKFQTWIDRDLGDKETSEKVPTLTIYNNKAGKPVFSYDTKSEKLTIIQNGLKLDQFDMYGLVVEKVSAEDVEYWEQLANQAKADKKSKKETEKILKGAKCPKDIMADLTQMIKEADEPEEKEEELDEADKLTFDDAEKEAEVLKYFIEQAAKKKDTNNRIVDVKAAGSNSIKLKLKSGIVAVINLDPSNKF